MSVVASDLAARVGALLDVDIDTSAGNEDKGTPSYRQVQDWLFDGARQLQQMLPVPMLHGFVQSEDFTDAPETINLDSLEMERVVAVTKAGRICNVYPYANLLAMASKAPSLFNSERFGVAMIGVSGDSTLVFHPADTADVQVVYVTNIAEVSEWTTATTNKFVPPNSWSKLMVDFAVIQGKVQDEEPQQVQLLYQAWIQLVQAMIQGGVTDTQANTDSGVST